MAIKSCAHDFVLFMRENNDIFGRNLLNLGEQKRDGKNPKQVLLTKI